MTTQSKEAREHNTKNNRKNETQTSEEEGEDEAKTTKRLYMLRGLHLIHAIGSMLVMNASTETLMKSLSGLDFTNFMVNNMSIMLILRMLTSPIFASFSDVYGRLKTLNVSLGMYMLTDLLQVISPTVGVFQLVNRYGGPLTMGPYMQLTSVMVADMFPHDAKRVSIEQGKFGISFMTASLIVPKLNQFLLSIGNRVPFFLALVIRVVETIVFNGYFKETLGDDQRKSFNDINLNDFNPLKFYQLFTKGTKLRVLACVQSLTSLIRTQSFGRIADVIRVDQYQNNWSIAERSTYQTFLPICHLPAILLSGSLYKKYGARKTFYTGKTLDIIRYYLTQFSYLPLHEFIALPFSTVCMPGDTAIGALLRKEAMKQGISKSEFSQMSGNLFQINMLLSGYLLNSLYANAVARGKPRSLYGSIIVFPVLQMILFYIFNIASVEDEDEHGGSEEIKGRRKGKEEYSTSSKKNQ